MYKVIFALVALAPLALASAPSLRSKTRQAQPPRPRYSKHADAVRELALAMREAETMPAFRHPRAQLRLVAANG